MTSASVWKLLPTIFMRTKKCQISAFSRCLHSASTNYSQNHPGGPSTKLPEISDLFNLHTYKDIHKFSIEKPNEFWGTLARSKLDWQDDFKTVTDHDHTNKIFRWFPDGSLNASVNCVDRHAKQDPNRIALIWEKDEPGQEVKITYKELLDLVCKISNILRDLKVAKGDRVVLYLPVSPIAVASMLACARIGAVHSIIFAGFSSDAFASRINDAQAEIVITCDKIVRGGKTIPMEKTVREAISKCQHIRQVLVTSISGADIQLGPQEVDLDKALVSASTECPPVKQNAEDPLFILYTSGSTGAPKGITHSTGGYLLYAAVTHQHAFDYRKGEIFACVADIGWITGHSYVVYGPLVNGATTVLFSSTPTYPDPGRYWETVSRLGINHFYGSPTAMRLLLRYEDSWVTKHDTSSLRMLGSVGEPLNHEAWHWFNDLVGKSKSTLVDTWWQTETGGIVISPRPSEENGSVVPGMPMRPMYGIEAVLLDGDKKPIASSPSDGALCIKSIWPGIARSIYNDHSRYKATYFDPYPGHYFSGDGAHRTEEGHYQITGRMDDVINITGHRLGTAEVEDAMDEHEFVAEAAVVGFPHAIKGEAICAFVTLKENSTEPTNLIQSDLKAIVKKQIAGYAVPETILVVPNLPKTRSGKIMRRILKKIAAGENKDLGDTSTLADPSSVEVILKIYNEEKSSAT